MINVSGLTKHYGDRVAVDNVSFSVGAGRVTGFVGPNGAGKSTTMAMMVDLTRPTDGSVRLPRACTLGAPPETTSGCLPP
jgi:ABC-2 type transport system ATP-binding protein